MKVEGDEFYDTYYFVCVDVPSQCSLVSCVPLIQCA